MSGLGKSARFLFTGLRPSVLSGIGLIVLTCSYSAAAQASSGTVHFPSARTVKDGDLWIGWDKVQRLAFINGYIQGNRDGHQKGCGTAEQIVAGGVVSKVMNELVTHCLKSEAFTKSPDNYAESITNFYQEYPQEREVPIRVLFQLMSDESGKTPEQMHAWFASHWRPHSAPH